MPPRPETAPRAHPRRRPQAPSLKRQLVGLSRATGTRRRLRNALQPPPEAPLIPAMRPARGIVAEQHLR
eukprot:6328000-Lingulodinium_polyedra.AAC.1